jgi:ATP-binding cassette subfamily C protein CydCD
VRDAPLVLLDEPTAGLDEASEQQVLSAVRDLARTERRAVILVAHRPAALVLADRVVRVDWRADAENADAGPWSPAEASGAVAGPMPVDAVA